jgi:hypothetical protein
MPSVAFTSAPRAMSSFITSGRARQAAAWSAALAGAMSK